MKTSLKSARTVMDSTTIRRAIERIAHEVLERNKGTKDVLLIGGDFHHLKKLI